MGSRNYFNPQTSKGGGGGWVQETTLTLKRSRGGGGWVQETTLILERPRGGGGVQETTLTFERPRGGGFKKLP